MLVDILKKGSIFYRSELRVIRDTVDEINYVYTFQVLLVLDHSLSISDVMSLATLSSTHVQGVEEAIGKVN